MPQKMPPTRGISEERRVVKGNETLSANKSAERRKRVGWGLRNEAGWASGRHWPGGQEAQVRLSSLPFTSSVSLGKSPSSSEPRI